MNTKKPDLKFLTAKARLGLEKVRRFSFVLFLGFVAILYGFVLLRVNSLSNIQPSNDSVTSQIKAAGVPHIDEKTVKQLESLQNNSVNVQALFNESRNNPFESPH
jgi:hypothetical protein